MHYCTKIKIIHCSYQEFVYIGDTVIHFDICDVLHDFGFNDY